MDASQYALNALGFLRTAVVSPEMRVADVKFNTDKICEALAQAAQHGCQVVVFPELAITGYTCGDLFYQALLLEQAQAALTQISETAAIHGIATVVGLPLVVDGRLYNCAAFLADNKILGIVPKSYLPSTNEYYEERWFTPANHSTTDTIYLSGEPVPFGTDLLFSAPQLSGAVFGIEICEDLWAVNPPSGNLALAGATVILNPSASVELLSKIDYRRDLVRQQSARCLAAYLYAGSSPGESTTDVVFGGHSLIAENGSILVETERFQFTTQMAIADVDVQRMVHERLKNNTFSSSGHNQGLRTLHFDLNLAPIVTIPPGLRRPALAQTPFVPTNPEQRVKHCQEIFSIQATGLAKRLKHTGSKQVTLGLSGGLDSTLALLVIIRAFDILNLSHKGIVAVTMPGFGTTSRTRDNAERLANLLDVTLRQISIRDAVRQHFQAIGHPETLHNVVYENSQARERTQILMDVANQVGGFVVGTGDLSELALGWATFNGDHMSMYHVNAGVPKTLVRYLIEWAADSEFSGAVAAVLRDINATPITPELLPLGEGDKLQQETESSIGPYVLHDFFLFNAVRYGFAPRKVFFLAQQAFAEKYTATEILRWLTLFYQRFFAQQYKRSAMPDGPKVGTVALSPRGDWRMPSDASSALWLAELAGLQKELDADQRR
ncbi:MAG: NAD(+) synthase [Caldilineaceae bacterium]